GERLMILSDGFIECTLANGEFLGEEGLVQLLEKARDLSGTALLETLVWDLAQALGEDGAFQDDVSGIAVEYFGNPKS
ncbi:MAG: SpoIIE family protein phosphatase, partial [Pseudomonadota bacterium]